MKLISMLTMAALVIPCCAMPASKAEVFSGKDVALQLEALVQAAKASGSSGATLGDYKSHAIRLSIRTASGGAEVHAYYDDIFVVTEGKAILVTGGTVLDGKTEKDGETKGSGIQNGQSQTIAKGDIVHIPAGTPHQLTIAPGDVFGATVVKVKEANKLP
jgi:mannose-6-phosphate isomerase-like protein (cupin superfamily)